MASNANKHKVFANGAVLYAGAGVGQNLGTDLDGNIADELDTVLHQLFGSCIFGAGAMTISAGAGLSVNVSAGYALVVGQYVKGVASTVSSLPASTTGIKIYVQAGTPFDNPTRAWPAAFGWTTGALSASQVLIATVNTTGGGIGGWVDTRVVLAAVVAPLIPTAGQKDALVGNLGTPGSANRYVTENGLTYVLGDLLPTIMANAVL